MYCREIRFWKQRARKRGGIMDDDTRSRYLVGVKKYSNLVMENSRVSGKGVKKHFPEKKNPGTVKWEKVLYRTLAFFRQKMCFAAK